MLKGSLIVDTVAQTLRTIPALVAALANDPTRIVAYHFLPGVSDNLNQAVNNMLRPGLLVAYEGCLAGNWDGMTMFKHHVSVYFRSGNQAAVNYVLPGEDVWALIVNSPVNGTQLPIINIEILPAQTQAMDVPSFQHIQDEELQDLFKGTFVIPEYGNQLG